MFEFFESVDLIQKLKYFKTSSSSLKNELQKSNSKKYQATSSEKTTLQVSFTNSEG